MKTNVHFFIICRSVLLRLRNVSDKRCSENQNTHCVSVIFFEIRTVYEKMWKNTVQRSRPQMTEWHMRIACWTTKAKPTLTICNIHCYSTATMVTRTRLIVMLRTLPVLLTLQSVVCMHVVTTGLWRVKELDMIYLLNAIGLSPGGSTHLHTNNT
jgi:hypothetical protein